MYSNLNNQKAAGQYDRAYAQVPIPVDYFENSLFFDVEAENEETEKGETEKNETSEEERKENDAAEEQNEEVNLQLLRFFIETVSCLSVTGISFCK